MVDLKDFYGTCIFLDHGRQPCGTVEDPERRTAHTSMHEVY